jgi:hypothetical protein
MVEPPLGADGVKTVRAPVAIGVGDARDLGGLRDVEGTVAIREPHHFIQAGRKALDAWARVFVGRAAHQQDFATPRADGQPAVGQIVKARGFDVAPLGNGHIDEPVVGFLALAGAPRIPQILRLGRDEAESQ